MGGALSVKLSECFMNKMERHIVLPLKPKFYRLFVDDTYRTRKKCYYLVESYFQR